MIIVYRGIAYEDLERARITAGWGPTLFRNIISDASDEPDARECFKVVRPGRKFSKRVQQARVDTAAAYKRNLLDVLERDEERLRINENICEDLRGSINVARELLASLVLDTEDLED
jgi:hypothetical protein